MFRARGYGFQWESLVFWHRSTWRKGRTGSTYACVCLCAAMALLPDATFAKPAVEISAREYQVKAAYLYRFLGFIHAPQSSGGVDATSSNSCSIAIIGKDPFGASFTPVEGRAVPGRKAVVRVDRFPTALPASALDDCLIAYICASEKGVVAKHLAACQGWPVLTVSDMEGFLEAGGMLRLVQSGSRLRWEINRTALDAAGLKLNSQLLRNAIRVVGKAP